jgi:anti-sigma B factor antagonist
MKIKETIDKKVAVLTLKGNLMGPPETLKLFEDVKNLLEDGIKRIVIDFKHVSWMNSLGVGAVMKCLTLLRNNKGYLYLVGLTEKVESVFVVTQLIKIFTIKDSVDDAVNELNNK